MVGDGLAEARLHLCLGGCEGIKLFLQSCSLCLGVFQRIVFLLDDGSRGGCAAGDGQLGGQGVLGFLVVGVGHRAQVVQILVQAFQLGLKLEPFRFGIVQLDLEIGHLLVEHLDLLVGLGQVGFELGRGGRGALELALNVGQVCLQIGLLGGQCANLVVQRGNARVCLVQLVLAGLEQRGYAGNTGHSDSFGGSGGAFGRRGRLTFGACRGSLHCSLCWLAKLGCKAIELVVELLQIGFQSDLGCQSAVELGLDVGHVLVERVDLGAAGGQIGLQRLKLRLGVGLRFLFVGVERGQLVLQRSDLAVGRVQGIDLLADEGANGSGARYDAGLRRGAFGWCAMATSTSASGAGVAGSASPNSDVISVSCSSICCRSASRSALAA